MLLEIAVSPSPTSDSTKTLRIMCESGMKRTIKLIAGARKWFLNQYLFVDICEST